MPIVGDKFVVDLESELEQLFLLENHTHLVIIHIAHDNPSIIPSQVISYSTWLFNVYLKLMLKDCTRVLHRQNVVFL